MEVIEKYRGAYTGEEIDELLSRISKLQAGSGDGDKFYKFVQENSEKDWEITHNLGKYPSVTVLEQFSKQEVFAEVEYTSLDSLIIRFSEEIKGEAFLN